MDVSTVKLVLAVLATWRVTHLLAREDGPADLVFRFRELLARSWAGKLMDCFKCLSLWIAAPAALLISRTPGDWLLAWLGLSGGACLLEMLVREPVVFEPMPQSEEGDYKNVLRSEPLANAIQLAPGENGAKGVLTPDPESPGENGGPDSAGASGATGDATSRG